MYEDFNSNFRLFEFSFFFLLQAAIEAIQHWSELHQKQQQDNLTTTSRDDQVYLSIVIKACYDVFDYPQGWLIDTTV